MMDYDSGFFNQPDTQVAKNISCYICIGWAFKHDIYMVTVTGKLVKFIRFILKRN